MKNILLMSTVAIFIACSGDDDNGSTNSSDTYIDSSGNYKTITIINECGGTQNARYCVTDAVYIDLMDQFLHGPECPNVTFDDIDGVERSGIMGGGGEGNSCTRNTNP